MKSQTNFVYRCLYVVSIREWSVLFDNISVSVVAASEIVELGKIGVECGCDWSSDSVALSPAPRSRRRCRRDPTICVVSRRAAVLIICVAVNEKDVCICTSRLSVDFHRRFVANVSHGYR